MKIFIAAGHGGNDPGSISNATTEKDEAIKVVDGAIKLLKPIIKYPNELILVPHERALHDTVRYINERTTNAAADICLEVHFNNNFGTPGTGTETYYGFQQLANKVHTGVVGVLKLKDRGVKEGNYLYFNNSTEAGSALVEIGFLNNPQDLLRARDAGALALAKGVADFLGLQLPTTPGPTPPTNEWKAKYEAQLAKFRKLKEAILQLFRDNPE